MSIGAFTDKTYQPSKEEILSKLGPSKSLWETLVAFVETGYRVKRELRFYGKNYGWAVRYRRSGKALISLYPADSNFCAQVVLSEEGIAEVLNSGIGPEVRQAIDVATPYPEGRWLFITIKTEDDLRDVQRLLEIKAGIPGNQIG